MTDAVRSRTIVRGDSWDAERTSPLPTGADVREGDTILAINGQPVSTAVPPQALLVNQAGVDVDSASQTHADTALVRWS